MPSPVTAPSDYIDAKIHQLGDWRGRTLARLRAVLRAAHPDVVEEVKWRSTPVWSCHGILCTGETYKNTVKLTFAHGAALPDPTRLFNASLDGNLRRAIDFRETDPIPEAALAALVRAAIQHNAARQAQRKPKPTPKRPKTTPK